MPLIARPPFYFCFPLSQQASRSTVRWEASIPSPIGRIVLDTPGFFVGRLAASGRHALKFPQVPKQAVFALEARRAAILHNLPFVQDNDPIEPVERGKAM